MRFSLALEAKSKLYEKLTEEAAALTEEPLEHRYLVRFDKKAKSQRKKAVESDEDTQTEEYENPKNPDEEW